MVSEASTTATGDAPPGDVGFGPLVNALVGGVVGIVISFVPFSPLLGGAVAGYLEGGDGGDGLKVGGIAGAIMLLPFVLVGMAVLFLLGFGVGSSTVAFAFVGVLLLVVGALYTVGLSVVGGYLGVYVRNER